jgi:hypothetical protein
VISATAASPVGVAVAVAMTAGRPGQLPASNAAAAAATAPPSTGTTVDPLIAM